MPFPDHFDLLAPFYEKIFRPPDPQELSGRIGLPTPGMLLDAGGGTGRVAQSLRGSVDSIVVADLSYPMVSEARGKSGLHAVCSHTERLPFPGGCFPRIIMVDAFHHVCDQRRTASELWRVLRPGGRLVIEEPDIRYLGVKLIAFGEKLALMRSRFLAPHRIAEFFSYPEARIDVTVKGGNAWIVVEKTEKK